MDDLLEEGAELRTQEAEAPRRLVEDAAHHDVRVLVRVGVGARGELVEQETHAVQIGASVEAPATLELLGCGVEHRTDEGARLAEAHGLVDELRHAQVHHLHLLLGRDQHVLGLEVAVHGTGGVDRGQRGADLEAQGARQLLGHPLQVVEQVAERLPLHVLHHEEVLGPAVVLDGVDVVGADDVGMVDAPAQLALTQEALEEVACPEEVRVHQLDGDGGARGAGGTGLLADRAVDDAHAAGAQLGLEAVDAQALRRLRGGEGVVQDVEEGEVLAECLRVLGVSSDERLGVPVGGVGEEIAEQAFDLLSRIRHG